MTKHIDRLMSRASVAVMAAFAPKPEGGSDASKIGQPERVSDDAVANDSGDGLGLSAEEQAQFDAMQGRDGGIAPPVAAGDGADAGDDDGTDGADDAAGAAGDADGSDDVVADAAADAPADGADDGAGRRPPKTISYGKYQREIQKATKARDDLQTALNGEREQRTRLDERTRMLLEAISAKPAAPAPDAAAAAAAADPEPDKEADPIGHLEWRNRKLEKTVADLSSGRQQEQQQTEAEREETQVYRTYEADLTREAAADPAFADAFAHLRDTRYRELGFIYADIDITDPAQCALLSPHDQARLSQNIQRSFHDEQMLVARQALQSKKSPAKVVKNLAISRGFAPKAAPAPGAAPRVPAKAGNGAGNGNGAQRQVAPADAGSVTDQLAAIRDGQDASRSLSDAGGSPGGTVTPERIANMSDAEFDEFYSSMPKVKLDALMGKPAQS